MAKFSQPQELDVKNPRHPRITQLPSQPVSMPPASQLTLQGSPLPEQVTLQVVPVSHTTSQPPPGQSTAHCEPLSQSKLQAPPLHW